MAFDAISARPAEQFDATRLFDFNQISPLQKEAAQALSQAQPARVAVEQVSGLSNIGQNLYTGLTRELYEHPVKLATNAALGASAGYAARLGMNHAPGTTIAGLTIAGAYGVYELCANIPQWKRDFSIAYNPQGHNYNEVRAAEERVQKLGGSALQLGVFALAGALAYNPIYKAPAETAIAKVRSAVLGDISKGATLNVPTIDMKTAAKAMAS